MISFFLHDAYPVIVYNKCSDFELTSPSYFGYNAIWIRPPDQKVDANAVASASFAKDIAKDKFASALIYKLQRKKPLESEDQSKADNTFTEDLSTSHQLLVIWRVNDAHWLCKCALLIKHSNIITWNEDMLEKLYSMYTFLCRNDNIEDTWLLDDATVLTTILKSKEESRTFEITISRGTREDDSMAPLWVSPNM
jgi:hypothetical protein